MICLLNIGLGAGKAGSCHWKNQQADTQTMEASKQTLTIILDRATASSW